jgi:hypothetical protein
MQPLDLAGQWNISRALPDDDLYAIKPTLSRR